MRIDREKMILEAMQIARSILTKSNVKRIERKNPFRAPTKKELAKHPKLIEKQRRLSMGE